MADAPDDDGASQATVRLPADIEADRLRGALGKEGTERFADTAVPSLDPVTATSVKEYCPPETGLVML